METKTLLPLDAGSILLPVDQELAAYPDIYTIQTDGEIIRTKHISEQNKLYHARRYQTQIRYFGDGGYSSWEQCVAALADKQAFGIRQDGETTTIAEIVAQSRTLEIEPIDKGGIQIATKGQLPIGVYLKTAESYRITASEREAILSYRPDNRSPWEEIESVDLHDCRWLVDQIASKTDMVSLTDASVEEIRDAIDENFGNAHKTARSQTDEAIYERADVETDTVFNPSIPDPAPLLS